MYLGRNPAVGTQKMLDSLELQFNGTLTTFDLRYGGVPIYPTLSESLIVSLGGVLQEPGEAFYVSSDRIVFSEAPPAGAECWILLYSQYGASVGSSTSSTVVQATGEPMGFENRTHSTISFNNATRTFSIAPNTAGGHSSYVIWTKGTRRVVSTTQSVQVGTSTGLYYIYFDANGDIQYKTTYFTWDTETMVAYVYWNSGTSSAPFIADERHGVVLDWQTHEYLHRTRGAVIAEGFSISAYTTTGNGNVDAHAQFDLGNGTFFDEDLEVNITHSATPTVGTFTQVLTGGAEIPVFYMSGSAGAWVRDSATKYACKQSATTLQYNLLSGSTWSTTPANDNRYVVSWIVATNDITAPVICILGQDQYTAIGIAEEAKFGDLVLTNFPIVEFRPLWKVIFQTSTGFTNTPNALIANILDLRRYSESSISGTIISDHGLLSGLADDDHTQYLHTTLTRAGITANISTTGNLGGANLTLTGELRGPSTLVIDPATVGDDTGLVRIKGDLEVLGATTNINSTTLVIEDKNIILGDTSSPTDLLADGGGITLKGTVDKTFVWLDATDAWTSSERISIPLGSAGTPSLTFTGDPNTGIYSPGADQVAISTGGSGRLFVDASGRILAGVSSTSATATAVLQGNSFDSTAASLLFMSRGQLPSTAAAGLGLIRFGDNSQNIGAQIQAIAEAAWTEGASYPSALAFWTVPSGSTGITERLRITSTGNVGIGTTNPQTKLGVYSGSDDDGLTLEVGRTPVGGEGPALTFRHNTNNGTSQVFARIKSRMRSGNDASWSSDLSFYTGGDALTENFTIKPDGNVGIGTTNPVSKFHINATGRAATIGGNPSSGNPNGTVASQSSYLELIAGGGGSTNSAGIVFHNPGVSTAALEYLNADANTGYFNFKSDDTNWGVGIGTNAPVSKLHIIGDTGTILRIDGNVGGTGTRDIFISEFGTAAYGGIIRYDSVADLFTFGTVENSNVITAINVARSTGNVGIGSTNPAHRLDVAGNIRLGGQLAAAATTTPAYLSLGTSFSSTPTRANCKIRLYDNGADVYGFNIGVSGDVQYHSTTTHQFYNSDVATLLVNNTAPYYKGSTIWHAGNDGSGSGLDADLWDGYHLSTRTNWSSNSAINIVVGQLAWKNYGNGHTIFDASQSTSPDGTSVNNTNPQIAWASTYPTLMGWNGANTYGVRVDSARNADGAASVSATADGAIANQHNGNASTWYGRILCRNSTSDRSVFLGTFGTATTGVFAHNNALNAWAPLYINTTNGVNDGSDVTIAGSGRVGIGVATPLQKLDVRGNFLLAADGTTATHITQKPYTINNGTLSWEGSAGQLFSITNNLTSGSIFSVNDVSGIPSIDVDANGTIELAPFGGNVGIGTTNPTTKLHVIGDILASGNVTAYSDSQLKDNVETIDKPLEKVLGLRGVTFTRVDIEDKDKKHIGVIAQEVEQVLPEVVLEHSDGIKSVAYGNMVGLLIEAIKEQQNQIESLKAEIESLKRG